MWGAIHTGSCMPLREAWGLMPLPRHEHEAGDKKKAMAWCAALEAGEGRELFRGEWRLCGRGHAGRL